MHAFNSHQKWKMGIEKIKKQTEQAQILRDVPQSIHKDKFKNIGMCKTSILQCQFAISLSHFRLWDKKELSRLRLGPFGCNRIRNIFGVTSHLIGL